MCEGNTHSAAVSTLGLCAIQNLVILTLLTLLLSVDCEKTEFWAASIFICPGPKHCQCVAWNF